jgi:hypothetical protein
MLGAKASWTTYFVVFQELANSPRQVREPPQLSLDRTSPPNSLWLGGSAQSVGCYFGSCPRSFLWLFNTLYWW